MTIPKPQIVTLAALLLATASLAFAIGQSTSADAAGSPDAKILKSIDKHLSAIDGSVQTLQAINSNVFATATNTENAARILTSPGNLNYIGAGAARSLYNICQNLKPAGGLC